eukprot:8877365-Pyramimonas_sp.AAC.1
MASISEERAKELIEQAIATAVAPGGAVYAAVVEQLQTAAGPGGAVQIATDAALEASEAKLLKEFHELHGDFDKKADDRFPWRAVLRRMSAPQWKAAWDVVTDPDS